MGISSLGVGSGILTQDVIDQLRAVDETQRIRPITLSIANENDKKDSLDTLNATMDNFRDAASALQNISSFNNRATTMTGSSVSVTAAENSDVQDFSISVNTLASRRIEQSGSFDTTVPGGDIVSAIDGTFTLQVGTQTVDINYTGGTTLDELKTLIQSQAGDLVNATVLQVSGGDSRLVLSSRTEGASQDISMFDTVGSVGTLNSSLTTGFNTAAIQDGSDSSFTFNGQLISRSTNEITDLITGYTINLLKEDAAGESTQVSVKQDRTELLQRVDGFVETFNATVRELRSLTRPSAESGTRGIFSSNSSVRAMSSSIQNMINSISGDAGRMMDFGFTVDKSGVLSVDKGTLNNKLDTNSNNVKAFFVGGDFTRPDNSVVQVSGAFSSFHDIIDRYTKANGRLDVLEENINLNIRNFEDRKESVIKRLDSRYEIMKKQFTSFNSLINRFNSASSIFTQLANAQNNR